MEPGDGLDPFDRRTWESAMTATQAAADAAAEEAAVQRQVEAVQTQAALLLLFVQTLLEGGAEDKKQALRLTRTEALALAGQVWRIGRFE